MGLDALIFDVDGTLADTEEAHRRAFNEAFARHALDWDWTPELYRVLLGTTGGKERIRRYIDSLNPNPEQRRRLEGLVGELHAEKTRLYTAMLAEGEVPLRPGVARLLDEAVHAGCALAIASTTTPANVHALLQATLGPRGLDLFSVIACGDQVRAKKPAPDIYRLVLDTLGLDPQRALALEDSVAGLHSARGAGLVTVITPTPWTEGGDFGQAALVLPHLGDARHPLPGEPGRDLRNAAWLGLEELVRIHASRATLTSSELRATLP